MDHESLYDRYMDLVMAEDLPPTPEEFLRANEVAPGQSPALEDGLRRLFESRAAAAVARAERGRGRTLGDFRLIERLGEGGMGVVWIAEQMSLHRRVALKVIRPEVAESLTATTRFEREARAIGRLHHPGIVRVYAVGESPTPDGRRERYIAMELVEGRGLDEVLSEARRLGTPIPPTRAARWGAGLARALQSAHDQGIIHRDVKPSNIRITTPEPGAGPDGRAMLLDFGLARDLTETASRGASGLTQSFVGTPSYCAPEQVGRGGGRVDGRTDVYSLGAVLYEALSGRKVVDGDSLEQALVSILTDDPAPLRRIAPNVPRDLSVVVMKALEKDPSRRYASAADLAADLEAVLELRPVAARPPGPAERLSRWALRNRGQAATGVTLAAATLVGTGILVSHQMASARERSAAIAGTLAQVDRLTRSFAKERESVAAAESRFLGLSRLRLSQHLAPEQDRQFEEAEGAVEGARRQRELDFYTALDLAARAEQLGADPAVVRHAKADLYLQRYLEAEAAGDPVGRAMYRKLVREHDPDGSFEADLHGRTSLRIETPAPGARFHLFRRTLASDLDPAGEPRNIAVPIDAPHDWRPDGGVNAWGLRVLTPAGELEAGDVITHLAGTPIRGRVLATRDAGEVRRGDRLVSIDGIETPGLWEVRHLDQPADGLVRTFTFARGQEQFSVRGPSLSALGLDVAEPEALASQGGLPADVWTHGHLRSITLPEGLVCRTTSVPLFLGDASRFTPKPEGVPLDAGAYVLVVLAPGFEPATLAFSLSRDEACTLRPQLLTPKDAPPAWGDPSARWVPVQTSRSGLFWMMEREVTVREYFDFLNDPAAAALRAENPAIRLEPLDGDTARGQRDAQGRFLIPEGWSPDWPILFVSWHGAKAYTRWLAARSGGGSGGGWIFDLASEDEWVAASAAAGPELLLWGPKFRPKWTSSCFDHPSAQPEPPRRHPIDMSVLGVYDLAGSVSEWTRVTWVPGQPFYKYAGGAWGTGDPPMFGVYGGNGALPETMGGMIGFRAVARRGKAAP